MSDWTIRPAVPEDEACIASMWGRQLCRSNDAKSSGYKSAGDDGSDEQIAYWAQNQPIVTGLLRNAPRVLVACDPERSHYEPGRPAVIWAWAVIGDDVVYGAGVKRGVIQADVEMARDILRDLLGDTLDKPTRTVLPLVDMYRLRMIPTNWVRDYGWASSLRQLSQRVLIDDAMYTRVASHILDPKRERWVPSASRAA